MPSAIRWFIVMFLLAPASAGAGQLPTGFVYLRDVAPEILQDMRYAGPDNFIGRPVPAIRLLNASCKPPSPRC